MAAVCALVLLPITPASAQVVRFDDAVGDTHARSDIKWVQVTNSRHRDLFKVRVRLDVEVANADPNTLELTWSGGPCDARDLLTIDVSGRQFVLVQPECRGDAVAFDRVLIVTFAGPVDASEISAILQDGLDTPAT
jgi:hypothetical protein